MSAYRDTQQEKYLHTLLIIKSIFQAAGTISAAVTGGNAPSANDVQELLSAYKNMLMPELKDEEKEKADRVKEIMERENEIGSFQVSALNYSFRPKKGFR